MARMTSKRSHHSDLAVSGTPEEVKRRLDDRLLRMGSVWFPTRSELRSWDDTELPLYIIRTNELVIEVGPHLANLWAACFSPVLRGNLLASSTGTTIRWDRGWPRVTNAVVWGWTAVLVVWLVVLIPQIASGSEHPIWLLWWGILSATRVAATALGGHYGGLALDEHMEWLTRAAAEGVVDEEDW